MGLLMLLAGIFLSYILVREDHRIVAQLGIPSGRSTPTTSNTTLLTDNKTGEAEPLGDIK